MQTPKQNALREVVDRMKADTPPFFKKLRTVGLILAAVGTSVLASPIALPAVMSSVAGYLILGGSILTTVSQTVVEGKEE
ncbi:hypothetical protein SAMN05216474_0792 [Lishizhenia tianjinensis]|uniref:Uncharacterized protein n=1 Tax=Lishizhenia tianjinensis TaxID=477690 RepID=A0A1I6YCB4_9FLAO|nr:hypothetical protein [Lishizhenia tianjinensis]SFT47961.1 hypothetical protein SAMN05216474_0792 [Lishizhenia tianjinensis]